MTRTRQITEAYRLMRVLKASPQTTVFQASDPQTGSEVVIKLLSPSGAIAPEASQERFVQAMEALKAANLESFPTVIDYGFQPDSSAFMVMEPAPGNGLDTLAGARPSRILPLLMQTVVALERLAAHGVAHHNLSPDNIVVTSGDAARIVGFGTAAFLAEADGSGLLGHSPESDRYAAPELLDPAAQRPAEGWVSDLYSLALITCELLDAPVTDLGTDHPRVNLPQRIRLQVGDADSLERTLAPCLRMDPATRGVTYVELREVLRNALSKPSAKGATVQMSVPAPAVPESDRTMAMPAPLQPSAPGQDAAAARFAPPPAGAPAPELEPEDGRPYDTVNLPPVTRPVVLAEVVEALEAPVEVAPTVEPTGEEQATTMLPAQPELETEPPGAQATVLTPIPIRSGPPWAQEEVVEPPTKPLPIQQELETEPPGAQATVLTPIPIRSGPPWAQEEVVEPPTKPLPIQQELETEPRGAQATVLTPIPIPAPPVAAVEASAVEAEGATVIAQALQPPEAPPAEAPRRFDPQKTDPALMAAGIAPPAPAPPAEAKPAPPPPEPKPEVAVPPVPPPKIAPVAAHPPQRRATRPTPPPHEPTPPPAAAASPARPEVERRPPKAPGRRPPWLLIAGGAAGFLVLVAIVGVVVMVMSGPATKPVPTPAPTPRPTVVATPVVEQHHVHPQLQAAESALASGDVEAARKAIAAISPDEVIRFSNEESTLHDQLKQQVQGLSRDAALKDLDAGLEQGNITNLRRAIPALGDMSNREIAQVAGLKDKLAQAREAVRVFTLLKRAADDHDNAQTLQHGVEMVKVLPANKQARDWREAAAKAIETEADGAATAEDWTRAVEKLQVLRTTWPERPGVAERIQHLEQQVGADRKLQETLDSALGRGRAGDPEGALQLLAGTQPSGRFTKLYDDARAQLQAQLEKMDAQPPVIVVVNPDQLQFKKKETARIYIRITDDYKVAGAKAMLRTEAVRTYKEQPLKKTAADQYLLEVPPEVHGGGAIEFYVEATDYTGHVGRLNSADKPYRIERKKWWKS